MKQALYIFFGLVASGKSTLAGAFAERHHYPYYNTDRVRKELAGIVATSRRAEPLGRGIYSREFTEKTYTELLSRARKDLEAGAVAVVLDGSYSRRGDRDRVRELGRELGIEPIFILCFCSEEETRRRLDRRARDPNAVSDGRWEIYVSQVERFEPPDELAPSSLIRLDTEQEPDALLTELGEALAGHETACHGGRSRTGPTTAG